MKKILVAFVGEQDLRAVDSPNADSLLLGAGPIAWTIARISLDEIILINPKPSKEFNTYLRWLKSITETNIMVFQVSQEAYDSGNSNHMALLGACKKCIDKLENTESLFILSSHGNIFNSSVTGRILKNLDEYVLKSQKTGEIKFIKVPFNNDMFKSIQRDVVLEKLVSGLSPMPHPEFENLIYINDQMRRLVEKAKTVSRLNVTVLIQGESGTGKELLARAIHKASLRNEEPFVAVNCGAIPSGLVESEFFGHIKGSFTGAVNNRDGYFRCANNGTLFLDEIGELPLAAQVKILRVIQEGELTPVGTTQAVPVNVRIVAATNRLLAREVAHGRFREDLFYRLAVAILNIPPLRDRIEDIDPLVDHILKEVGDKQNTKIHSSARTLLKRHRWPGNVRELQNTVYRATLWSGNVIMAKDIQEALLADASPPGDQIFDHPFTSSFELQSVLDDVARHYLARAIKEAGGNKTKAAKMLGFKNQQTLTNWLIRTGVEVR